MSRIRVPPGLLDQRGQAAVDHAVVGDAGGRHEERAESGHVRLTLAELLPGEHRGLDPVDRGPLGQRLHGGELALVRRDQQLADASPRDRGALSANCSVAAAPARHRSALRLPGV